MHFHGVVARAAGHAVQRQAKGLHRALPALLPGRVAGGGAGAHAFAQLLLQAPALANGVKLGQHVGAQGVALRIRGRAHIQRELAAPGYHIDRACGHLPLADGGYRVAVGAGALLHIERQLGHRAGRIAALVHGRGAGVAGRALHRAHHAHTGVDRCHHAQRYMQRMEHRPLFNMHFHKAQVLRWVAFKGRDAGRLQAGGLHGGAHADAVRVFLLQPLRRKTARQRRGRQKGGSKALAFFFRKRHHFDTKRQAAPGLVQRLHAGQRHKNTQPPVVLAAVAHRVVVAAGH